MSVQETKRYTHYIRTEKDCDFTIIFETTLEEAHQYLNKNDFFFLGVEETDGETEYWIKQGFLFIIEIKKTETEKSKETEKEQDKQLEEQNIRARVKKLIR